MKVFQRRKYHNIPRSTNFHVSVIAQIARRDDLTRPAMTAVDDDRACRCSRRRRSAGDDGVREDSKDGQATGRRHDEVMKTD